MKTRHDVFWEHMKRLMDSYRKMDITWDELQFGIMNIQTALVLGIIKPETEDVDNQKQR